MSPGEGFGGIYDLAPYCGAPPDPAVWLVRWNLDPYLITCLSAALVLYQVLWVRSPLVEPRGRSRTRRTAFFAGWLLGSLALVSPLCPLSVSLFSARVGQHMWLISVAAPLIAWGLPRTGAPSGGGLATGAAAALFAALLWFWHAPGPYLATFQSDLVYWLMHATTFGAAVWLWRRILTDVDRNPAAVLAGAALTTLQMGLLGALITFAGHPFYGPHALTTVAWGLTQLEDQQLGGVIMWVPPGLLTIGATVGALALAMRRALPADQEVSRA